MDPDGAMRRRGGGDAASFFLSDLKSERIMEKKVNMVFVGGTQEGKDLAVMAARHFVVGMEPVCASVRDVDGLLELIRDGGAGPHVMVFPPDVYCVSHTTPHHAAVIKYEGDEVSERMPLLVDAARFAGCVRPGATLGQAFGRYADPELDGVIISTDWKRDGWLLPVVSERPDHTTLVRLTAGKCYLWSRFGATPAIRRLLRSLGCQQEEESKKQGQDARRPEEPQSQEDGQEADTPGE